MNKIKKITILQLQKFFAIILFLTVVFFERNSLIDSYNRKVDLNIEKTIIIAKEKSDNKFYENLAKTDKENFSNKITGLILMMILLSIVFYNIQNKINTEKKIK
jgi:hypothetical protein